MDAVLCDICARCSKALLKAKQKTSGNCSQYMELFVCDRGVVQHATVEVVNERYKIEMIQIYLFNNGIQAILKTFSKFCTLSL